MNTKIDTDIKPIMKILHEMGGDIHKICRESVLKSASVFASAAQKNTPPEIGKASLKRPWYFRQIKSLKEIAKNKHGNSTDYEMLRKGYLFKVFRMSQGSLNTPKEWSKAVAYAKTMADAKKLAKIETRGLWRAMWGKSLYEIGAEVPTTIKNLLLKSPKLQNMDFNEVKLNETEHGWEVSILNKSIPDKLVELASDRAMYIVGKELEHRVKAMARKNYGDGQDN